MEDSSSKMAPRVIRILLKENGVHTREIKVYPDHSPASILNDYIKACGYTLRYQHATTEKGHGVTVFIDDVEYKTGHGKTKMAAKQNAAKLALEIAIPQIKNYWTETIGAETIGTKDSNSTAENNLEEESLDVISLCLKLDEPFPYKCLEICFQRNFGLGELNISELQKSFTVTGTTHHCKLILRGLIGEGIAESRKMAQELAAYQLLMELHPVVPNFSGILKIYGKTSQAYLYLEKKKEEQLQVFEYPFRDKPRAEVNFALLEHLRKEMRKCTKNSPL